MIIGGKRILGTLLENEFQKELKDAKTYTQELDGATAEKMIPRLVAGIEDPTKRAEMAGALTATINIAEVMQDGLSVASLATLHSAMSDAAAHYVKGARQAEKAAQILAQALIAHFNHDNNVNEIAGLLIDLKAQGKLDQLADDIKPGATQLLGQAFGE